MELKASARALVESFAPFFLRTAQEADALLDRFPELDARTCNSYGTYFIVVDAVKGLRFYVESACGQTIAERHATHQQKLEAVREARRTGGIVQMRLATESMELLYGAGVRERECQRATDVHLDLLADTLTSLVRSQTTTSSSPAAPRS